MFRLIAGSAGQVPLHPMPIVLNINQRFKDIGHGIILFGIPLDIIIYADIFFMLGLITNAEKIIASLFSVFLCLIITAIFSYAKIRHVTFVLPRFMQKFSSIFSSIHANFCASLSIAFDLNRNNCGLLSS